MTTNSTQSIDHAEQLVRARRATRVYQPGELADADVRRYLELVMEAPSSFNIQDRSVVVVRDPDVRAALTEAANGQQQVANAPLLLAFIAEPNGWHDTLSDLTVANLESGYWDDAAATERNRIITAFQNKRADAGLSREFALRNAMIAASYGMMLAPAFGWASSPMTGFDADQAAEVLGLSDGAFVALLLAVGEPAESPDNPGRFPLARRVYVDQWQGAGYGE
ncbi:nitroreductase family protein [Corynebacterium sp. TAE3-ERU12]|uniref:nitroreductase family protein n=1 Tax=Corynebacterium sp. TAE3-ERU12 TaxID=2849491 RepID=UPI001C47F702|nr:nitroreductase family protein [Corynebacterium sp. TAE3-ERU12]MBV7294386.1 nitroreductase family protein [Corynebacterium sp. TAE3-ERU12]